MIVSAADDRISCRTAAALDYNRFKLRNFFNSSTLMTRPDPLEINFNLNDFFLIHLKSNSVKQVPPGGLYDTAGSSLN